jgi:hypothetical protein
MGDNEYLMQQMARDRLREARVRAARDRWLADEARRPTAGTGRNPRLHPNAWRVYGAVARSLISRWRNWRPA